MNSKRYKHFDHFPIEHGSYAIRPVQSDDIQLIREWRNAQLEVLRQSQEISEKQQEDYFKDKIWSELSDPHPSTILLIKPSTFGEIFIQTVLFCIHSHLSGQQTIRQANGLYPTNFNNYEMEIKSASADRHCAYIMSKSRRLR